MCNIKCTPVIRVSLAAFACRWLPAKVAIITIPSVHSRLFSCHAFVLYTFNVLVKLSTNSNRSLEMFDSERYLVESSNLPTCIDRIANLSTIHWILSQFADFLVDVFCVHGFVDRFEHLDEVSPDFQALTVGERTIGQGELDPGLEGFVKVTHTVTCKY